MNLIIEEKKSEKVVEIQSRLDVDDFKKPKKPVAEHINDTSQQIKLINGYGEPYDKKQLLMKYMSMKTAYITTLFLIVLIVDQQE